MTRLPSLLLAIAWPVVLLLVLPWVLAARAFDSRRRIARKGRWRW